MKSKKNLIILAMVIAISLFGVTYAFFDYYRLGANQKITAGKVNLILNDGTTNINLTNVFPETIEKARKEGRTDNIVTFTVNGTNTTEDQDIYYEIMLNEGDPETGMTRFNPEDLVFDLIEVNGETETYLVDAMSFSDINARRIWVDTITKGTSTTKTRTYKLRMWLNEDVKVSDTNANANYPATGYENYYASVKVSVYGDFVEKGLPLNQIAQSTLTLTEPDVDGTRFVYGETVDNNYVWYSGKLWRIVSIAKAGNIKLVTQGNMTSIKWDTSMSIDYSNSQIRKWLNNEFLPTLYNADNLLTKSIWDYTTYESFPTEKLQTTSSVTEKIGMLNIYEIMMTGGTSLGTANTFLNNEYRWWTLSPKSNNFPEIWHTLELEYDNRLSSHYPPNGIGIRPSVVLNYDVDISGGNGKKDNPYIINGDINVGISSEFISKRIVGEYINFNGVKYRIVKSDNGLTKVTMADYSKNNNTLSTSVAFGKDDNDITFNVISGIGEYLNGWYNATEESDIVGTYTGLYINETYKKMIATESDGVLWYLGPETGSYNDYTLSQTGLTVVAPIGSISYGEIFSSHFGEGTSSTVPIWMITKSDRVSYIASDDVIAFNKNATSTLGVRPSFYLKSNVVIGDTNGDGKVGTGMPHDPYEIVQLSE